MFYDNRHMKRSADVSKFKILPVNVPLKSVLEGGVEVAFVVFICLGRQTKQIMVAKFHTLLLLIASAESSPLF
jgi:uncharacterized membrane protein